MHPFISVAQHSAKSPMSLRGHDMLIPKYAFAAKLIIQKGDTMLMLQRILAVQRNMLAKWALPTQLMKH